MQLTELQIFSSFEIMTAAGVILEVLHSQMPNNITSATGPTVTRSKRMTQAAPDQHIPDTR